jgi:hypothetical protein
VFASEGSKRVKTATLSFKLNSLAWRDWVVLIGQADVRIQNPYIRLYIRQIMVRIIFCYKYIRSKDDGAENSISRFCKF